MRAITTKLLACFLVCCLYSSIVQAQWTELPRSTTDALFTALEVDQRNGTVYSAHANGKLKVRRLNAQGEWEDLGATDGISPGNVEWISLAVDGEGVVYAAFTDIAEGVGGKASVMKYNEATMAWEYVGAPHLSVGGTRHTQVTFDNNNVPYVAFRDIGAPTGDVKILKYDATAGAWEDPVTGSSTDFTQISSGDAGFTYIDFGSDNTLYVAYQDLNSSDKATVKKLVSGGNAYEVVGTEKFTETAAEHIAMAVDNDDNVYITYGLKNTPVNVKMFDNSPQVNAWVNVGDSATPFELPFFHNYSQGEIRTDLFIDNSNQPVVAYLANNWRGLMYRFDGTEWTAIGGTENLPDHHRWPSYAIDKATNKYYVSGRGGGGTESGRNIVRMFNCGPEFSMSASDVEVSTTEGTDFTVEATGAGITYQWQVNRNDGAGFVNVDDGDNYSGATTATLSVTAATVEMNGYEYRAVANSDCGDKASESATLRVIPPAPVWTGGAATESGAIWTSIDLNSEGVPYVFYSLQTVGYQVKKQEDGVWVQVGPNITNRDNNNTANFPYIALDHNDIPYVAYQDVDNAKRLTVKKFNGTDWEIVGAPSEEEVRAEFINFDNNNVPYVFYRNVTADKGKVIKLVDGEWQQVGGDVSGTTSNNPNNLAFDENNIPYVVFHDGGVKVRMYNADTDSWDAVGGALYTGAKTDVINPFLAFDNNNVPHVLYNDVALGKATVKKWDGTSWVPVGTAGFSAGSVGSTTGTNYLFFGADNTPYVSFNDAAFEGGRGVFMRYDGTNWEVIGGELSSGRSVSHYGAAMDVDNGVLYFSYRNTGDGGKVYVRELKVGPPINLSPEDKEVIEGESISFSGIAAGRNLTYQWQVDEGDGRFVNISSNSTSYSGVNSTTLKIELATMEMHENKYRMVAIGEWGASATDAANLTVISSNTCFAPVVSTQPLSIGQCPGSSARFVIDISEGSEPQYQWQVSTDGTTWTKLDNGGIYSGVNSKVLSLNGLTNDLNGNIYRAVVTTGCSDAEAITNPATLTVYERPTIVTQPVAPETVCPDTETTISVGAIGNAVTYKWQLSVNGSDFTDIADGEEYAGASTSALTIKAPTSGMNGNRYRVVTAGSCQPLAEGNISNPVTLNVFKPLVAGTISGKQSICYNTVPNALLNTGLATGSNSTDVANYEYQWQSSVDKTSWTDISGAGEVDYAPQELSETTYFRRKVTNVACSQPVTAYSEPVKVTVFSDLTPGEIEWTGNGDVAKGTNAAAIESSVDAAGGNIVAYQWESSADGTTFTPIAGATGKDFAPAGVMETRTYRRVATSERGCGTVISNAVTITVRENNFDVSMVPNAVLPNSNSLMNKTWGIKNLHYTGNVSIRVFDIKGNTVFTTEDPGQEWDATYNGGLVPAGTYYYSIENGDKKVGGSLKVIY